MAIAVAAAALAACTGTPDGTPQPSLPTGITAPPPTPVATPTPEAPDVESQLPAEIAGVDTSGWQQIPAGDGAVTFRIPADWSTQEADGGLAILRGDGERQLGLVQGPDTGDGSCLDASGTAVSWRTVPLERDAVDVAGAGDASFGAAALQLDGQWIVSVGLVPTAEAASPRCPIVHDLGTDAGAWSFGSEVIVTGSGDGSPWAVGSLDDARAYVGTEEFRIIRAILMSFEVVS